MSSMIAEQIGNIAYEKFSKLPQRCKPRSLPDGRREWTSMSAIMLNHAPTSTETNGPFIGYIKIVALATGTKSLPVSTLPKCNGLILHDCHAEILALRAFNYWLLCEMKRALEADTLTTEWLEFVPTTGHLQGRPQNAESRPFRLRKGTEVSLFSTEAPCGDASMEIIIASTEAAGKDIKPWALEDQRGSETGTELPPGRGCFSKLGVLRRKPARADAEISMSMSCTDKLMLKQITGLLSFPVDLYLQPSDETLLQRMVVPNDAWNEKGYSRAFSPQGRLKSVLPSIDAGTSQQVKVFQVSVLPTDFTKFEYGQGVTVRGDQKNKSSNVSALWIAGDTSVNSGTKDEVTEVLINGVKQGFRQFDERSRKGSVLCRRNMLKKAEEVATLLKDKSYPPYPAQPVSEGHSTTYSKLKSSLRSFRRAQAKQIVLNGLGGWPIKVCQDDFEISKTLLLPE